MSRKNRPRSGANAAAEPGASSATAAAIAVAASMLVYWTGTAEIFGIVKLILASAALCAGWLWSLRVRTGHRPTPLDAPLAALFAACAASLAFSPDRWVGMVGVYGLYNQGLPALLLAASAYWIVAENDNDATPLRWVCAAGLASGVVAALQGLGTGAFIPLGRSLPQGRANGLMGDPVLLGASLIAVLPIAGLMTRSEKGAWRFAAVAAGVAAVAGIAASGSRGAWLGGAAAFGVWYLLDRRARGRPAPRPRWIAAMFAAFFFAGGAFAALRASSDSDVGRVEVWKAGISIFRSAPVFGVGLDRFQTEMRRRRSPRLLRIIGSRGTQVSAHNDWLQILTTAGIFGGLAWLWLHAGLLVLLRDAWSREESRSRAAAAAGVFAGLFLQAKVNPLPLACLLQGAVVAGGLAAAIPDACSRPSTVRGGRAFAAFGVVLTAAVLLLALRLAWADAALARAYASARAGRVDAALAGFADASRRNPYEMHYRLKESRALYGASQRSTGARRLEFIARAIAVGDDAVRFRPTEAEGHLIRATYRLVMNTEGGEADLSVAAAAVETALAIDPFFIPALENGAQIAALENDAARAARLTARLETVRGWMEGR